MRAAATVMLLSPDGSVLTVRPGDEFPEWANVTNPEVIADEPKESERKPARAARRTRNDDDK